MKKTNTTTNKYLNNATTIIANRVTEVTTKHKDGTTTQTTKAVNLKVVNFANAEQYQTFKKAVVYIANTLNSYENTENGDKLKKYILRSLTDIYAIFEILNKDGEPFTAQKQDFKYLLALSNKRTVDKTNNTIVVNQVSINAIITLINDLLYFRYNNINIPKQAISNSLAKANEQQAKADAKAKAKAEKEASKK